MQLINFLYFLTFEFNKINIIILKKLEDYLTKY